MMKLVLLVALVVVLAPEMTSAWRVRSFISRTARTVGNVLRKKEMPVERDLAVNDMDLNEAEMEQLRQIRDVLDLQEPYQPNPSTK